MFRPNATFSLNVFNPWSFDCIDVVHMCMEGQFHMEECLKWAEAGTNDLLEFLSAAW